MTNYDDSQIVDYLFDEMSEEDERAFERIMSEDPSLSREVQEMDDALDSYRTIEDVEPSAHLDSLIMATAREVAEQTKAGAEEASIFGRLRKFLLAPAAGLVAAASVAVVAGVFLMQGMQPSPEQMAAREAIPLGASGAPTALDERSPEQSVNKSEKENSVVATPPPPPLKVPAAVPSEERSVDTADKALGPKPRRPRNEARKRRAARTAPKPVEKSPSVPRSMVEAEPALDLPRVEESLSKKTTKLKVVGDTEKAGRAKEDLDDAVAYGSRSPRKADSAGSGALGGLGDRARRVQPTKPSAPVAAQPAPTPSDAPAPTADLSVASRRAAPRPQAGGKASTKGTVTDERAAAELARAMISAADQELKRGQVDSARRILGQARARTLGTPSEGDVLLRWAYLERDARRFAVSLALANAASDVKGFTRRREAQALARQVASLVEPVDQPASAAPARE